MREKIEQQQHIRQRPHTHAHILYLHVQTTTSQDNQQLLVVLLFLFLLLSMTHLYVTRFVGTLYDSFTGNSVAVSCNVLQSVAAASQTSCPKSLDSLMWYCTLTPYLAVICACVCVWVGIYVHLIFAQSASWSSEYQSLSWSSESQSMSCLCRAQVSLSLCRALSENKMYIYTKTERSLSRSPSRTLSLAHSVSESTFSPCFHVHGGEDT